MSYKIVRGYVDSDGCFNVIDELGPEYEAAPELVEALKVAYSHLRSEIGDKEYVENVLLQAIDKIEGNKK